MGIKRMNKFLENKNLIKIHNNLNDMIRNNKQTEYQVLIQEINVIGLQLIQCYMHINSNIHIMI